MTLCISGDHEFPTEDETGAYCREHGVTLLWHPPHFAWDDLLVELGHLHEPQDSAARDTAQGS
ncbi:hypothetical protein [Streptomyces similanensis]|uniref:Uncharacterized protein n=1 Tax=Streptomyces similanensis TaxID=1274988 RepID=A0ABP9LHU4_9ACTN